MTAIRRIILLGLITFLAACGGGADDGHDLNDDLSLDIATYDKFDQRTSLFFQGEEISIDLSVTNHSFYDVTLYSYDTQLFEFYVIDANDNIVWAWSDNRYFDNVLTPLNVRADSTYTVTVYWDQIVDGQGHLLAPGTYTLEGFFIGLDAYVSIRFEIL